MEGRGSCANECGQPLEAGKGLGPSVKTLDLGEKRFV